MHCVAQISELRLQELVSKLTVAQKKSVPPSTLRTPHSYPGSRP